MEKEAPTGQNITLRIAGKDYSILAKSPESEQLMRLAAEDINALFAQYNASYPDKSELDKFVFVTLTETVAKISALRSTAKVGAEADALEELLGNYLAGIDTVNR